VEAFGNATDALRRLDEFRPRVILLDIVMPGLSGLAALGQIRVTNPEVGIIMVTGNGDDAIARKTLAQGAFDYITKPIDLDYLKWSLETFLLI
jgi:DNA-binding NtrC family response regulator